MSGHHFLAFFFDGEKIKEESAEFFPVKAFSHKTIARAVAPAPAAMSEEDDTDGTDRDVEITG